MEVGGILNTHDYLFNRAVLSYARKSLNEVEDEAERLIVKLAEDVADRHHNAVDELLRSSCLVERCRSHNALSANAVGKVLEKRIKHFAVKVAASVLIGVACY